MPMSQRYWRPEAHQKQRPHAGMNEAATWSPTASVSTPGPHLGDDARSLVAADHREHRLDTEDLEDLGRRAHVAGAEVLVGVAHARRRPSAPVPRAVRGARRRPLRPSTARGARNRQQRGSSCGSSSPGGAPPGASRRIWPGQHRAIGAAASSWKPASIRHLGLMLGGDPRRIRWPAAGRPGPPPRSGRRCRGGPSR